MANEKIQKGQLNWLNAKASGRSTDNSPKYSQIVVQEGLVGGTAVTSKEEMAGVSTEPEAIKTPSTATPTLDRAPVEGVSKPAEKKEKTKKGLVNQASTIKISKEAKKRFDAIRSVTGNPPAYEMLELMMDAYYHRYLDAEQKNHVDSAMRFDA